jgi:membrane protein implicated in regulation of membrane protease activity
MEISPESWSWIWLVAAAFFITGETFIAGTFILIPFGFSAILAMILALMGAPVYVAPLVFLIAGTSFFIFFWRKNQKAQNSLESPPGAGHDRLIGSHAMVLKPVDAEAIGPGLIQVGGEQWRAISANGSLPVGTLVEVTEIRGTRAIVRPLPKEESDT